MPVGCCTPSTTTSCTPQHATKPQNLTQADHSGPTGQCAQRLNCPWPGAPVGGRTVQAAAIIKWAPAAIWESRWSTVQATSLGGGWAQVHRCGYCLVPRATPACAPALCITCAHTATHCPHPPAPLPPCCKHHNMPHNLPKHSHHLPTADTMPPWPCAPQASTGTCEGGREGGWAA